MKINWSLVRWSLVRSCLDLVGCRWKKATSEVLSASNKLASFACIADMCSVSYSTPILYCRWVQTVSVQFSKKKESQSNTLNYTIKYGWFTMILLFNFPRRDVSFLGRAVSNGVLKGRKSLSWVQVFHDDERSSSRWFRSSLVSKTMGKIRKKNNGQDGLISQGQCERRCHAIARSTTWGHGIIVLKK
jgi:hypothetical protein